MRLAKHVMAALQGLQMSVFGAIRTLICLMQTGPIIVIAPTKLLFRFATYYRLARSYRDKWIL